MNWFQRYGIPGAYFIGLMAGWVYAFYPNLFGNHTYLDPRWLVALAAITFLPIGYVISIFSQFVYLILPCLGVHRAAARNAGVFQGEPNNERFLEARTLLLTALADGIPVSTHQYIRNWIARRMDVVAINQSIIWATVFAGIIALVLCLLLPGDASLTSKLTLSIISIIVITVMVCSKIVLRRQVIRVIAGVYRQYRNWNIL